MKEFPTIVTASLAKQIAESLREMILSGKVKVDERLPTEEELAQRFGVSRPTIREALKRLAAENLIHSRRGPQGGTRVKRPSPQEVSATLANTMRLLAGLGEFKFEDIFEARCALESACCQLIVTRKNNIHFQTMHTELAKQADPALSDEEFCASDVRFHHALVAATQNPILQYMLDAIGDALQPITNLVLFRFRDRKTICSQHQRLLQALENSAPDTAIGILQEQARYLTNSYSKAKDWRRKRDRVKAQAKGGKYSRQNQ